MEYCTQVPPATTVFEVNDNCQLTKAKRLKLHTKEYPVSLEPEARLSQHCEALQIKQARMFFFINTWIGIGKTYLDIQIFLQWMI